MISIMRRGVILSMLIGIFLLTSCSQISTSSKNKTETLIQNKTISEEKFWDSFFLNSSLKNIIYRIYSKEDINSLDQKFEWISFVWDDAESLLITNRHVVDLDQRVIIACNIYNNCNNIENIRFDQKQDLAKLKINNNSQNQILIKTWYMITTWNQIFIPILNSENNLEIISSQIVWKTQIDFNWTKNDVFKIDFTAERWMSWTPILNHEWDIIAILQAKDSFIENTSYIIPL